MYIHVHVHVHDFTCICTFTMYRSNEIDDVIEQQLKENKGFVDNFARGTAHMFK